MLTQERIQELFNYCPESGIFTRLTNISQCKVGDIAGSESGSGYLTIRVDGKAYYTHRLAWLYVYGEMPNGQIDHINHVRSDNRLENLRVVDDSENRKNTKIHSHNTSGQMGVYWNTQRNRWQSAIKVDGHTKYLGLYADFSDAVNARKNAEVLYGFHENHGKDVA